MSIRIIAALEMARESLLRFDFLLALLETSQRRVDPSPEHEARMDVIGFHAHPVAISSCPNKVTTS